MTNNINQNILVSIDALFDTPLQVYKVYYNDTIVSNVLSNWGKVNRHLMWDNSYGIPMEDYLDNWNNRGNDLLHPKNGVTPLDTTSVLDLINIAIETSEFDIDRSKISIIVNQHPFELSEVEQKQLSKVILNTTGINCIFKNIKQLEITPSYLNGLKVGSWFDIDIDKWIGHMVDKIGPSDIWTDSMVCTEIRLYTPKVFNIVDGAKEDINNKLILKGKSIWEVREQIFKPLIDLDYIDTVHFTSTKAVKALEISNTFNTNIKNNNPKKA